MAHHTQNIRVLIPTGFGLNCDRETDYAFQLAGATPQRVHINHLIGGQIALKNFDLLVLGGGFSWGDDHGAGVIQAVRFQTHLGDQLRDFVARGKLVLGICNGFQTLVNLGLLPGLEPLTPPVEPDHRPDGAAQPATHAFQRKVALVANDCGNFRNQWVHLRVNSASPCVFTRNLGPLEMPVRHGEGKFYAPASVLDRLWHQQQIVLQYADADGEPANGAFPANPNGSLNDIAGICDVTGRILGLMPHPEAWHHPAQHPDWTRWRWTHPERLTQPPAGLQLLRSAVQYLQEHL